jgi:hypothetical protein
MTFLTENGATTSTSSATSGTFFQVCPWPQALLLYPICVSYLPSLL